MLYTIINNKGHDEDENMMYMIAYGEGAVETLQDGFDNYDGSMYLLFRENLSRKKDVVPAIVDVLKQ